MKRKSFYDCFYLIAVNILVLLSVEIVVSTKVVAVPSPGNLTTFTTHTKSQAQDYGRSVGRVSGAVAKSTSSTCERSGGPSDSKLNKREMDLTLRDFMKNCDGQCFFYPDNCDCSKLECEMVASIIQQSPDCN